MTEIELLQEILKSAETAVWLLLIISIQISIIIFRR